MTHFKGVGANQLIESVRFDFDPQTAHYLIPNQSIDGFLNNFKSIRNH